MVKAIAYIFCALLVIGSAAQAEVGPQTQIWNIGLTNGASMISGTGNAGATQSFGTLNIQGNNDAEGSQGWQGMGSLIGQTANVFTVGAPVSVDQSISIAGDALIVGTGSIPLGQNQTIGDYAAGSAQYEGVSVGATQTLAKLPGGTSTAIGGTGVGFAMAQVGGDPVGTALGQGTLVIGAQQGVINGATAGSAGSVTNGISAIVIQDQVTTPLGVQ